MKVACHFRADEIGLFVRLRLIVEFHFGNDQPIIFTMKLVNFEGMASKRHKPTVLVNNGLFTQLKEVRGLFLSNLLLELIA